MTHTPWRYTSDVKWLWALAALLVVELVLLIAIGRTLGPLRTFILLFAASAAGAWIAKSAGLRVVQRWREALRRGEMPQEGLLDGALVLAAGALLFLPGVLTDVLGLLLLWRPVRRRAGVHVRRWLDTKLRSATLHTSIGTFEAPFGRASHDAPTDVVDIEGEVIDPARKPLPPPARD